MAEKTIVETDLNAMTNRKNGRNIKRSFRRKNILKLKPLQQSLQQEVVSPGSTHCADSVQPPATLISLPITEKKTSSPGKVDLRKSRRSEVGGTVTCDGDTKKLNGGDCGVTTAADFENPPSTRSDCGPLTSESKKDGKTSNFQNFRYQKKSRNNFPKNEDHEKNQERVVKPELTPANRNSIYEQHPDVDVNVEHSVTPKKKRNKKKKNFATKPHLKQEQESIEQVQQQTERQGEQSVPMISFSDPSNVAGNQTMLPTQSSYPNSLIPQNIVSFQSSELGKKARSNKAKKHIEMAPIETSLGSSATEDSLITPHQVTGEASNDLKGSVKKDLLTRNVKSSKRDKKNKKGKARSVQTNEDLLPSLNLRKSEVTSTAAVSSPEPQESESRLNEEKAIKTSCDHSGKNKSYEEMKGLSPITVGSSVLLEPMPPSNCDLEAPKLCELSPQSTEATTSISETPQSPIHRVFTNAAGAAILRTISCNANTASCSSSVSSNMPLTSFSVSPNQLESGIAPMSQPHYVPGKIFAQSSDFGNVRTYPFSGEVNERLQPYPYSNAGWMFMPVFPEGYYPPPPVLYPYAKMRYEALSPSIFQQQHFYPQDMNCPSDTSSGGISYSSNFGPDYWGVFYSNRMGPPLSDGQNHYHYLNVEAPEFNPTKFHLQ